MLASALEQKPVLASALEQKPVLDSALEQKPVLASALEQKPVLDSALEQKPALASALEQLVHWSRNQCNAMHLGATLLVSLVPKGGGQKEPGTHCLRMFRVSANSANVIFVPVLMSRVGSPNNDEAEPVLDSMQVLLPVQ